MQELLFYQEYPEQPFMSPDRDITEWAEQVRIGKEKLVPKRNMIRTEEGLLPGDIILLWRVHFGTFTTESWFPKYFEYTYGIHGEQHLRELVEKGYVLIESVEASLRHVSSAVLKQWLKDFGVKGVSSLKRAAVEERFLKTFSKEEVEKKISIRGYQLTQKGQQALENHPEIVKRHPQKKF